MSERPDNLREERLARLLTAGSEQAPAPDRELLDRLRESSTTAFLQHELEPTPSRRVRMFLIRAAIALAATAAALAVLWVPGSSRVDSPLVAAARTFAQSNFHARIVRDGRTLQAWGDAAGRVRVEEDANRYQVGLGDTLYVIDEAENQARPVVSPYYSAAVQGNDPFALLGITDLAKAREGKAVGVYFCAAKLGGEEVEVQTVVDRRTQLPRSIRAESKGSPSRVLAEFTLLAAEEKNAATKFVVADTLTEDGRIGKIADSQGLVSLRPAVGSRWTPVCGPVLLRPGDWIRTDNRGANAVTLQLAPQTKVIVGPGSLVELSKPDQLKLISGIAEITPSETTPLKLSGPAGEPIELSKMGIYRVAGEKLAKLDQEPRWLKGFKGTVPQETLGSLVALVDGRNVPLTVGYHKVTVEIRDQIARTTIEESFVNHTKSQLEGVFHFPLPQDASISGFGMWIGDKLVEADVVEKQRAREIYETILREKRDPGLLEWTGGNIFKARVYPIFPESEKRIKIVYTQVLPKQGNSYRYSYALQSELLRQNPLRQLEMAVTVNSTLPLAKVSSPTHPARIEQTPHSARVEFSAQAYTPTRDFEVVVESAGGAPDLALIPHRRGDDGYFMLLLQPPSQAGAWQRDVLPEGVPLKLIVLADTSASMSREARKNQAEVLAALLSSLGPKDTFELACCDADFVWSATKAAAPSEKSLAAARDFLAARRSLGWTDLDQAFAEVRKRCDAATHVVYLGDGIVTTGDADPVAFAQRLARDLGSQPGTFHAIAVTSSFEPTVLKGIASLGGGSVRHLTSEVGPQQLARDLLAEIAQPSLRNIQLEFTGLRTARVYPRVLPNIPAGTQQIILGRYLPTGDKQMGEVVATGTLNGQRVTYRSPISLPALASGGRQPPDDSALPSTDENSFIPRLWARMHLDELLAQGTSQETQDEIIALSEEFHLITPYTSLLVLETDADRERFKVKKRFQMRDGERFFAAGRDRAQFELVQQQMHRAALWRANLRQRALQSLASLGRDAGQFADSMSRRARGRMSGGMGGMGGGMGGGGGMFWDFKSLAAEISAPLQPQSWFDVSGPGPISGFESNLSLVVSQEQRLDEPFAEGFAGRAEAFAGDRIAPFPSAPAASPVGLDFNGARPALLLQEEESFLGGRLMLLDDGVSFDFAERDLVYSPFGRTLAEAKFGFSMGDLQSYGGNVADTVAGTSVQLPHFSFLTLPDAVEEPQPRQGKSTWPREAQEILHGFSRREQLRKLAGALAIEQQHDSFGNHRLATPTSREKRLDLYSTKSWLTRTDNGAHPLVNWCDGQQRGALSLAFDLAYVRSARPADLSTLPLALLDPDLSQLDREQWWRTVAIERPAEGQVLLVLRDANREYDEVRYLVDTAKHVILQIESRWRGKVTGRTQFSKHVEVAGIWWPQQKEVFDREGRRTDRITQTVAAMTSEQLASRIEQQLAPRDKALVVQLPLPKLAAAQGAAQPSLEDRLALLVHHVARQQHAAALAELAACEPLAAGKPGVVWLRLAVLQAARRNEELRGLLEKLARDLGQAERTGEQALADHLQGIFRNQLEANEQLPLLELLKPVYARQPAHAQGLKRWTAVRVQVLREADRPEQARALLRQLANEHSTDVSLLTQAAASLAEEGDEDAANALVAKALANEAARWSAAEETILRQDYANRLEVQGRYAELVDFAAAWMARPHANQEAFARYLSSLIFTNCEAEANERIAEWLKLGLNDEPLDGLAAERLRAAVRAALGEGRHMNSEELDERWLQPLADLVLARALDEDSHNVVWQIWHSYLFQQSDVRTATAEKLFKRLVREAATLAPAELARLVEIVAHGSAPGDRTDWLKIAATVQARWDAEPHPHRQASLTNALAAITAHLGSEAHLAFLRHQLQQSQPEQRAALARQLFQALLQQPWSSDIEAESLGLIDQVSDNDDPAGKLLEPLKLLHAWTDRMQAARKEWLMAKIERPHRLTRSELAAKQAEIVNQVRSELAARLAAAEQTHPDELGPWLQIERLHLEIQLERELPRVTEQLWKLLGDEPPAPVGEPETTAGTNRLRLAAARAQRLVAMLSYLATQKGAAPATVARLKKYLVAASEQASIDKVALFDGKAARYTLLVALDRPQELAEALQAWAKLPEAGNRWRKSLAHLLAEQGKLPEAIALLEAVETTAELAAADYRALAQWYQAANRREAYERATVEMYKTLNEYEIHNLLERELRPWQTSGTPLPEQLHGDVPLMFAALFEKASSPQSYLWSLQQFYEATHDFRLLAGLANATVGHSAQKIYPFLGGMQSVLQEIEHEATVDELVRHIAAVRERAKTPVDQRALDLFELLVARRACELQNQAGPHLERALAALERAEKRAWGDGEPRLMAELLARLGRLQQPALKEAQFRLLNDFYARAPHGSLERLQLANSLARAHGSYDDWARASDLLETALVEYRLAADGKLPAAGFDSFATLVIYLQRANRHFHAEQVLLAELPRASNRDIERSLTRKLYDLYNSALKAHTATSLGRDQELYQQVRDKLIEELKATPDQRQRQQLVERFSELCRTAHAAKIASAPDDLQQFARNVLPQLLSRQVDYYQQIVKDVADTLRDLSGPLPALAFLVERIEQEPNWLRYKRQRGWQEFHQRLAEWRRVQPELGELEPRLLAIVVRELKRDLARQQQSSSRIMYHRHYSSSYFWSEKQADFVRAAEEVLAAHQGAAAVPVFVATYLFEGLDEHDRAIAVLLDLQRRKLLNQDGQAKLVNYLHAEKRYGESIALLEGLVEQSPDTLRYRTQRMHAYFKTEQPAALLSLLQKTDEHFHQQERWQEDVMGLLGASTLENELFEQAAEYYKEAIARRQETQGGRGVGDATLSEYYQNQARAFAGLQKTAEAVDAASSAIVVWSGRRDERENALHTLRDVLEQAADLDAYVRELDQEASETGQDRPVVRKALGKVYQQRSQFAPAAAQYRAALQLTPGDAEVHTQLIECLDAQQDAAGALAETLEFLELDRRNLDLWVKLSQRFTALQQPMEAERAVTSLVEVLPNETEGHTKLAEIRQQQGRYADAIGHWREVARLRKLEPTGLLRLAAAQLHEQQRAAAEETLRQLEQTAWPSRFDHELRSQLPKLRAEWRTLK